MSTGTSSAFGTAPNEQGAMQQAAGQTQEKAQELAGQAQDRAGQAQVQARQVAGQARSRLREELDQRSSQVAEQITTQASDLRSVSDTLREQRKEGPANAAGKLAEYAERVGGYLRDRDSDALLADAEDLGRRQPWALAAGGVVLGLAAARFLKASSARRYASRPLSEGRTPASPGRAVPPTPPTPMPPAPIEPAPVPTRVV